MNNPSIKCMPRKRCYCLLEICSKNAMEQRLYKMYVELAETAPIFWDHILQL